jgi:ABC-type nitrate/sulfonate/bicarbonate transport system permease component
MSRMTGGTVRVARGVLAALLLPVALLAIWWVLSAGSTSFYMPPLRDVFTAFPDVWTLDQVNEQVVPSVVRLAAGFALAVAIGVGFGVVIGSLRRVRAFFEPVLEFLRAVPPTVLVPVFMLFAGLGDLMKVLVIVSGAVWPILLNTIEGVRAVDGTLRETCRCYRIRGGARLWHLVIRSASPQIVTGLRQGLSVAIILTVISELFAADNGIGYFLVQSQRGFAIVDMWTAIIVLGLLGVVLATLLRLFEWRTLRWYRGLREAQRGRS